MLMKYVMFQRLEGDKWVNCSCHYIFTPHAKILMQYDDMRRREPGKRFRIVKGRCNVGPPFFSR